MNKPKYSSVTTILDGISPIVESYEVFLVDAWGVLHDGQNTYPGVLPCLEQSRVAGKHVIILSNAGRRAEAIAEEMVPFGVTGRHFDGVVSSGEEAWQALRRRDHRWHRQLGRACYFMGPRRSVGLLDGLDLDLVSAIDEADFILNAGAEPDQTDISFYEGTLAAGLSRDLPMLCVNPDLVAVRAGLLGISAGAIAVRYQGEGGEVYYHGKPHAPIYETCFRLFPAISRRKFIAIGDGLRTDIAGAAAAGIDSVFVTGGIHNKDLGGLPPDPGKLAALCREQNAFPTFAISYLRW